jgi:hypothetical protein
MGIAGSSRRRDSGDRGRALRDAKRRRMARTVLNKAPSLPPRPLRPLDQACPRAEHRLRDCLSRRCPMTGANDAAPLDHSDGEFARRRRARRLRVGGPAAGAAGGAAGQDPEWTTVSLDRTRLGGIGPGNVFYRDVAPGTHEIAVRSEQLYPDQAKTLSLGPGTTTFIHVQVVIGWGKSEAKPTRPFTLAIVDPATAERAIAPLALSR